MVGNVAQLRRQGVFNSRCYTFWRTRQWLLMCVVSNPHAPWTRESDESGLAGMTQREIFMVLHAELPQQRALACAADLGRAVRRLPGGRSCQAAAGGGYY